MIYKLECQDVGTVVDTEDLKHSVNRWVSSNFTTDRKNPQCVVVYVYKQSVVKEDICWQHFTSIAVDPPLKPLSEEEFKQEQIDVLKEVPEEFRSTLSYMAYEQGHPYGRDEVLGILKDLVDSLKDPIKNFEKRLTGLK